MHKSKSPLFEALDERESGKHVSFTTKLMIPIISFVHFPSHAFNARRVKSSRFASRLRNLFILITLFAFVSLAIDGFLISQISKQHTKQIVPAASNYPTLIPMPSIIYPGQISFLRLAHFTPHSQVFLSRDVATGIRIDTMLPVVHVDSKGDANVRIYVDDDWNVGIHYIQAEDMSSHFTASTVLRIVGTWLVPPPHLEILSTSAQHAVSSIDMGVADEGANTLQLLSLRNTGGSVLSWNAHSDQPWLQLTPNSGVFNKNEHIYLAVNRTRMPAGRHTGTITIVSNAGMPLQLSVKMQVRSKDIHSHQGLVISSSIQTFTAVDGESTIHEQTLHVTNQGKKALNWSLKTTAPAALLDQNMAFLASTGWLKVTPEGGRLTPGQSETVHVMIDNQPLLPSVYGNILQFTSDGGNIHTSTQGVALSLTILPRCGLDSDQDTLHFYNYTNNIQGEQSLTAHKMSNCANDTRWGTYTPYNWLTTNSAHGTVTHTETATIEVQLKSVRLTTGLYTGFVMLFTQHRSQTIIVTLNVLAVDTTALPTQTEGTGTPQGRTSIEPRKSTNTGQYPRDIPANTNTPASFVLSASSLAFTVTQGQQSSATQLVTIENTGSSPFNWSVVPVTVVPWLHFETMGGTVETDQAGALTVLVDVNSLSPGTYKATVLISATDTDTKPATSSSQTMSIVLTVTSPCTFNISPSSIHFSAILLQPHSVQQTITITASGTCAYPLNWSTQVEGSNTSWLTLSSTSGSDSGTGSQFIATIDASDILLGVYQAQIEVSELDTNGEVVQNTTSIVMITLTVVA